MTITTKTSLSDREFCEELDGRITEICLDYDGDCGNCPLAILTPAACDQCCMGEVDTRSPVAVACLGKLCGAALSMIYPDVQGIRHCPGRCCPDYDCLHPDSWDRKHCRSCGADCTKCPMCGSDDGGVS